MSNSDGQKLIVLSIEDDDAAFGLLEIAFKEAGQATLYRAVDGEAGLQFLRRLSPYNDAPRPHLVLLNLNMPRVDGFQVLEAVQGDPMLKDIPVVVFSSSTLDADRARCLALGAKHFRSKPDDLDELLHAARAVLEYAA